MSGSIGLGHVTRDREIARALRSTVSDLEIRWLAAGKAAEVLKEWGEDVLPESAAFHDGTDISDAAASGFSLNLVEYFLKVRRSWSGNARVFSDVLATHDFDLVVADEAYELGIALANDPDMLGVPFVMIYDFMGFGPTGRNPLDACGCWWINRLWSGVNRRLADRSDVSILFAGEEEDVPDDALAPLLPSRREHAWKHFRFLGHILTFDPLGYRDRAAIRKELGWAAREEVIVVTAGGRRPARRVGRYTDSSPILSGILQHAISPSPMRAGPRRRNSPLCRSPFSTSRSKGTTSSRCA